MTKQDQVKDLLEPIVISKTKCNSCKHYEKDVCEYPCNECSELPDYKYFTPSLTKQKELTDLVEKIDEIYKTNDKGFIH